MLYANNFCTYTKENDSTKGHRYIFTGKCIVCGNKISVEVPADALYEYNQGKLIQDAMSMVSASDREFLISGCCDSCFDEMWKEEK